MLQLRLDFDVNNYTYQFDTMLADDTIYMNCVPLFSQISNLNFGISVEGGESGEYKISLLDEDEVVYQNSVPVSEWTEGNLHGLPVDWKLIGGRQYTLQIDQV